MNLTNVERFIYDCEVSWYDWLFIFKWRYRDVFHIFHNDYEGLKSFMENSPMLVGFNCKHYDQWILKATLLGYSNEDIKKLSEWLVKGNNGWQANLGKTPVINQYDLFDDCYKGLSLKAIEAHLGMDIRETTVSFDLKRPWTEQELAEMVFYCKHDIAATEKLDEIREGYTANKITLGAAKGIPIARAAGMTNAMLTAKYLDADPEKSCYMDERAYHFPDKLKKEYVPDQVIQFFEQLHDESIEREDLFSRSLDIEIGGCPCTVAFGGVHGAKPCYQETATDTRSIRNKDVASYYPHLMTLPLDYGKEYGFCSRAIPDPSIFVKTLEDRVQAKRNGDSAKNKALKLVLNTTFGCMGAGGVKDGKYYKRNDLYDPLMARSVCITGQLFLLELTCHLVQEIPSLKVIQLNTDGIMVSFDNEHDAVWQEITQEWQDRTGFELEEDFIKRIVQRDVNNYVEVAMDDSVKVKGGELVRGISEQGAWKINNTAVVMAEALTKFLGFDVPIEDTILADDEPLHYQIIAKAGGSYRTTVYETHGRMIEVQKVNRVYASKDWSNGRLYKIKGEKLEKIANLPASCIVDNDNHVTIDMIDKAWYIRQTKLKADAFVGKPKAKRNTRQINTIKQSIIERMANEWQQLTIPN